MISRIGNQLFQLGRYLERAEQVASFTKVQYLSAMDAPFPAYKTSIWAFLLDATQARQSYFDIYESVDEEHVLRFIAIEEVNPASIRATVAKARELARGARNSISAELWEHINSYYHTMIAYTEERLKQKGFYSFAQKAEKYSYTIKGYIDSIMLRNEEWKLLAMGYHLERAIQANHLLLTHQQVIARNRSTGQVKAFEDYQMRSMLEGLGSYEMYKQYYQSHVNERDFLHFMILNTSFPKSIAYNLERIKILSREDGVNGQLEENIFLQQLTKLIAEISVLHPDALQGAETDLLTNTLKCLHNITDIMEQEPVS